MAIDFSTLLTTEQKRSVLTARVEQFANEGYQHTLNKQISESVGDAEGVAASDAAIATISAAIEIHQAELAALPAE